MEPTLSTATEIFGAIAPLAAEPGRAGAFFDLDGTLAPIVARPEDAQVPDRTRELVARIADRYAVCGVLTGRRAADAKRILGLERLTYIGNHGFEVSMPGADEAEPAPALAGKERLAPDFLAGLDPDRLGAVGLRVEDKGAIVALHWRGADDGDAAAAEAEKVGAEAEAAGLLTHGGRMVLELRPPVELDKGAGLTSVLRCAPIEAAFYAGDDRTDVDAFRALRELVDAGRLQRAVCVAVLSDETPAEVPAAADLAVAGPSGFLSVLEALA